MPEFEEIISALWRSIGMVSKSELTAREVKKPVITQRTSLLLASFLKVITSIGFGHKTGARSTDLVTVSTCSVLWAMSSTDK